MTFHSSESQWDSIERKILAGSITRTWHQMIDISFGGSVFSWSCRNSAESLPCPESLRLRNADPDSNPITVNIYGLPDLAQSEWKKGDVWYSTKTRGQDTQWNKAIAIVSHLVVGPNRVFNNGLFLVRLYFNASMCFLFCRLALYWTWWLKADMTRDSARATASQ